MEDKKFEKCMFKILQGDQNGLRDIYEAYKDYIFALILSIVKRRETAQDLTTDFFVQLWNKADLYRGGNGHKAWISAIARNLALDWIRKQNLENAYIDELEDMRMQITSPSAEQEVIHNISFKEMIQGFQEIDQQILILKLSMEMTFKEIALVLGMPMGTVTWRYQKCIQALKRANK